MNARARSILDEARKLSREEQLELIDQLLSDADIASGDPEAELLPELDSRWRAFESGHDKGEDAVRAIEDIRARIKSRGAP